MPRYSASGTSVRNSLATWDGDASAEFLRDFGTNPPTGLQAYPGFPPQDTGAPAPSPTPSRGNVSTTPRVSGMAGLAGLSSRLQGASAQAYGQMPGRAPSASASDPNIAPAGYTQAQWDAMPMTERITVIGRPVIGSMAGQTGTATWGLTPGQGSTQVRDAASRFTTSPEMSDFYGSRTLAYSQPDELFAPSKQVPWHDTKALTDWASRTSSAYPAWKGLGRR